MTDEDAVRAVVQDHVESWFDGDAELMERVQHPRYTMLEQLTAREVIELTAKGTGREEDAADREIAIDVSQLNGDRARAICLSHRYAEVLELVRTTEGWKILTGACETRASIEDLALPSTEDLGPPVRCERPTSWLRPRRPAHGSWRRRRRR